MQRYTTRDTRYTSGGFSLLETLVATSILLFAVTSGLFVASQGISFTGVARDQITAFLLAQEAVEYIRNVRDDNALSGDDWLNGLSPCAGSMCTIDVQNDAAESCSGTCPLLRLSDAGVYNYQFGDTTIFRRSVAITETTDDKEAVIEVTMEWRRAQKTRSFSIEETIFNWR